MTTGIKLTKRRKKSINRKHVGHSMVNYDKFGVKPGLGFASG